MTRLEVVLSDLVQWYYEVTLPDIFLLRPILGVLHQNYLKVRGYKAVARLPDPKIKTLGKRGIECIFVGYVERSKAFRFYVIVPNESVLINSIIKSRDAIFDENRFSSVPRPSQRSLINGTEDIGILEVFDEVPSGVIDEGLV
ncbi:hypothetical protein Tco_1444541 [Tanacetum coccineum]